MRLVWPAINKGRRVPKVPFDLIVQKIVGCQIDVLADSRIGRICRDRSFFINGDCYLVCNILIIICDIGGFDYIVLWSCSWIIRVVHLRPP